MLFFFCVDSRGAAEVLRDCAAFLSDSGTQRNKVLSKLNEILAFVSKWMGLENIMLREIRQWQKNKGKVFSLICGCTHNGRNNRITLD